MQMPWKLKFAQLIEIVKDLMWEEQMDNTLKRVLVSNTCGIMEVNTNLAKVAGISQSAIMLMETLPILCLMVDWFNGFVPMSKKILLLTSIHLSLHWLKVEVIGLLSQLKKIIGIHIKIHVSAILIVLEKHRNVQDYFGKQKKMEEAHLHVDPHAITGLKVHVKIHSPLLP